MELNKQLLAKTNSKPNEENVILSGNVCVTVLTDRMVRVEYSPAGDFTDLPFQSVIYMWVAEFPH